MKSLAVFILLTINLIALYGQKQIDSQSHGWYSYFGNHRITEKWGVHTEYQFRRNDIISNWQQSLMRVGVDRYLKNGGMLTAGYGWIRTFPYGTQPIAYAFDEHRIWEQFIVNHKLWRFNFQHRYRLEQRFLETKVADSTGVFERDGFAFRQRFRYRGMVTFPLSRKEMEDKTLFAALYDEFFLGFGSGIAKNIMDQNRLYFGLGWRFNPNVNLQAGYMNQFLVKTDGIRAERNHTVMLSFTYNLDLR